MTNTAHYNLAKPDPAKNIDEEFMQLQQTLDQIDTALHGHDQSIAGKADEDHGHPISAVTGLPEALASKMPASQTFALDDLTDVDGAASASTGYLLIKTPSGWVPAAPGTALGDHEHPISKITGLQNALDGKASATAVSTALSAKADTSHAHTIADVTSLQAALDAKADLTSLSNAIPVGTSITYSGIVLPSGFLKENGAAISRTVYSALFEKLTQPLTVTTASGSAVLSAASVNITGLNLTGAKVEGAGIPAGTTVVSATATSITISANATAAASGVSIRLFPHGNGDGSTTFNVPDSRAEFVRGVDDGRGVDTGRGLGTSQASQNLAHNHTGTADTAGSHSHTMTFVGATGSTAYPVRNGTSSGTFSLSTDAAGAHTHNLTIANSGGPEARPRNVTKYWCIKF